MTQINDSFLIELFKSCLTSKSFLDITYKHLEYHYIPDKHYKLLFEKIVQEYELTNELPTIGSLSQYFNSSEEVLKILHQIRNAQITGKQDIILSTFEKYLVNVKFIDLYTKIGTLHNEGKQDKAIQLLSTESQAIANFSIKETYYVSVFDNFLKRQEERKNRARNMENIKIPFSIHPLDYYTRGGMSLGTSALFMARSGGGKSTALRWVGASAARLGYKVVHFQAEGTEQECLDAYDANWTSIPLEDMEFGIIPTALIQKIEKARKDILAMKGDVYVKAAERFDEMSINDCCDVIEDLIRIYGELDLGIFDYAQLFTVKGKYYNSEKGERKRLEDIARKITNVATTFNMATLTGAQSTDIQPAIWNNSNFVMTRSNLSEFKGFVQPFSYFCTFNQTEDELENGILRIYNDKFRKYKAGQTFRIAQSLDNSRFYDSQKTLSMFWDDLNKVNKGIDTKKK